MDNNLQYNNSIQNNDPTPTPPISTVSTSTLNSEGLEEFEEYSESENMGLGDSFLVNEMDIQNNEMDIQNIDINEMLHIMSEVMVGALCSADDSGLQVPMLVSCIRDVLNEVAPCICDNINSALRNDNTVVSQFLLSLNEATLSRSVGEDCKIGIYSHCADILSRMSFYNLISVLFAPLVVSDQVECNIKSVIVQDIFYNKGFGGSFFRYCIARLLGGDTFADGKKKIICNLINKEASSVFRKAREANKETRRFFDGLECIGDQFMPQFTEWLLESTNSNDLSYQRSFLVWLSEQENVSFDNRVDIYRQIMENPNIAVSVKTLLSLLSEELWNAGDLRGHWCKFANLTLFKDIEAYNVLARGSISGGKVIYAFDFMDCALRDNIRSYGARPYTYINNLNDRYIELLRKYMNSMIGTKDILGAQQNLPIMAEELSILQYNNLKNQNHMFSVARDCQPDTIGNAIIGTDRVTQRGIFTLELLLEIIQKCSEQNALAVVRNIDSTVLYNIFMEDNDLVEFVDKSIDNTIKSIYCNDLCICQSFATTDDGNDNAQLCRVFRDQIIARDINDETKWQFVKNKTYLGKIKEDGGMAGYCEYNLPYTNNVTLNLIESVISKIDSLMDDDAFVNRFGGALGINANNSLLIRLIHNKTKGAVNAIVNSIKPCRIGLVMERIVENSKTQNAREYFEGFAWTDPVYVECVDIYSILQNRIGRQQDQHL